MAELAPLAGGAGVFGILGFVIFYLLKSNRDDRVQFGKEIDDAEARADRAEQRAREVQVEHDTALKARWAAEAREAEQAREFASQVKEIVELRKQIEALTAEVAQLREHVT